MKHFKPAWSVAIGIALTCGVLGARDWKSQIRPDHPRVFFNRDTWPAVRSRALGEEAALFKAMQARVDTAAASRLEVADYGTPAAESAFVALVTGEERYFELAKNQLNRSLEFYRQCHRQNQSVNWYSFSRINAVAAFDWIFNKLSKAERKIIGAGLLEAIGYEQPTKGRRSYDRENWGGTDSGFYSTPSLLWYVGLATYRDGINDPVAADYVARGYDLFLDLLRFRSNAAADDGGSASGALNYSLAAYPWAEFNFFHSFQSATGYPIAGDWPYVAYLPAYIFWNWLPGGREFGYGDAYHTTNQIRLEGLNIHLSQIIQLYSAVKPESARFARWLLDKTPRPREERGPFPFARFLLTSMPSVQPAPDPGTWMPLARHFENMGQTFFRSGSGPDDTYALFTAGGVLEYHKQYDHNNFVLYKKGFLAVDTGTRPEPGQHLTHYYSRTIAHNCVLIHMPGEVMPRYWGNPAPEEEKLPYPNDGGQREVLGSRVVAFESQPEYAYVAGDATPTYHQEKCRLALRQFVFIPPNHFVVFDRVNSTKPDYKKTWLFHTVEEPAIRGDEFTAVHEQGRVTCRTILPERASLGKVGGPGKQFWSDGRNWPLPRGSRTPDSAPLLGQWRIEISPEEEKTEDVFLHLIRVEDVAEPDSSLQAEVVRTSGEAGVRFHDGPTEWEVVFGLEGAASGRITASRGGAVTLSRVLSREVAPQKGLYATGDTAPAGRPGE